MAQRRASSIGAPLASSAARMPLSASPAPVVSTGVTGVAGRRVTCPPMLSTAPSAPNETITGAFVRAGEIPAAASGSADPVEQLGLALVGGEDGCQREQLVQQGPSGRRIDDEAQPLPDSPARGGQDGVIGDLEAQEADGSGGRAQLCRLSLDHAGVEAHVGALGDGDLVLADGVDDDERQPGVLVRESPAGRDIDPFRGQPLQGAAPEVVLADRAEHDDGGTHPAGGHGLVGALAPVLLDEAIAQHGLAGRGQARDADDEVDVDRPGDDHHRHPLPSCPRPWHILEATGLRPEPIAQPFASRVSCLP